MNQMIRTAVILAGGFGTRLAEETHLRPKPMVEIGGMPILWHIMKIYYSHGVKNFIICAGYMAYAIKEFFQNYRLHQCDVTYDFGNNSVTMTNSALEDWSVSIIDTGPGTMTGGRLLKVAPYINERDFFFTYGDGVGDIDLNKLVSYHFKMGRLATVTAASPPGRFGLMGVSDGLVRSFDEKPESPGTSVNAGFFVLNRDAIGYIENDATTFELEPLRRLSAEGQLACFEHRGFWQPMDTVRDRNYLNSLWEKGEAPWMTW